MAILRKIGIIFLRISVSVALLIFLFKQVDPGSLLKVFGSANKTLIWLSFWITSLGFLFCFLRWKMLLEVSGIRLPLIRLISAFSGGIFFNLFLPSSIGGDFLRSADIGYHSKNTPTAVASVLLDRLSGFTGMMILALTAVTFGVGLLNDPRIIITVLILTVILISALLLIFNDFLYSSLRKLISLPQRQGTFRSALAGVLDGMHAFKGRGSVIWKSLVLSVLVQAINPTITYFIAVSFNVRVNIAYFFIFCPIVSVATFLPLSIGGLGIREYTTITLFQSIGISKDVAFAFSLLSFVFLLVYSVIGGLVYVFTLHHRRV